MGLATQIIIEKYLEENGSGSRQPPGSSAQSNTIKCWCPSHRRQGLKKSTRQKSVPVSASTDLLCFTFFRQSYVCQCQIFSIFFYRFLFAFVSFLSVRYLPTCLDKGRRPWFVGWGGGAVYLMSADQNNLYFHSPPGRRHVCEKTLWPAADCRQCRH